MVDRDARTTPAAPSASETCTVSVKLMADLRRFGGPAGAGPRAERVRAGTTLAGLAAAIGIPVGEPMTLSLNGELADPGQVLADGDVVVLFSQMEGG